MKKQFVKRLRVAHLIEECTALCLWTDLNCEYEVYPSPRNLAMTETYKRFVLPLFPNLLHPLSIKFKNRGQLKPQQLYPLVTERLEMLENIIGLMPGHVYWVDRTGFYLGCNETQAKSAGLSSRKAIIGKKNRDLPWNYNTSALPETLDNINRSVIETGSTISVEEPAVLQDGTELTFLSHKVPLRNHQGSVIGMVGISIDITKRKKMEEALRLEKIKAEAANQAKDEFLNNMRHDITTALVGILGVSQILTKENNLSKIHAYSEVMVSSSQELLRFLNEILDSIEVGSGTLLLLDKKFSLKNTLENILALHQPLAIQKHLSLTLDFDAAIPNELIGDPVRIYRIALELVANALKFTKTGEVKVCAKLENLAKLENVLASSDKKEGRGEQTARIKLSVEDTGIGIAQDQQSQLFIRFNRLTPSYQGIYKGTGLGLSIVKQFVQDLKGEIHVESEVNQGSKFSCVLPLKARW